MNIIDLLRQKLGNENVLINEPMSKHTSFKTGGPSEIFVKVKSVENLQYVIKSSKNEHLPLFVLGNGSNILVTDKGIKGITCKIELEKFKVEAKDEDIFVTIGSRKQKCRNCTKIIKFRNRRL